MQDTPLRISMGPDGQKLLRLDRPTHPEAESDVKTPPNESERRRFWATLWNRVHTEAQERRGGTRHEVVDREIWVGWGTPDCFLSLDGVLINLSRGGALIVLGDRPPRDRPVWVYRPVGAVVPSVRGEVVGVTPAPGGAFSVRFRFATPCPTALCASAVCGPPGNGRAGTSTSLNRPRS